MFKELAIPSSITDMIEARDRALSLIESAEQLLKEAEETLAPMGNYLFPMSARLDGSLPRIRVELDQRMWSASFTKAGFFQVMDAQAKNEFEASVARKTPVFSIGTVRSTFLSLAQESDKIFKRGLVNVFLNLSRYHVTNQKEPFKVGKKVIKGWMTDRWSGHLQIRYEASAQINDIDRVFKILDGKKHNPRELENQINAAWKKSNVFEDDYYRIKGFKNGNIHIEFKRSDLLKKANRLIHEYYQGEALSK